MLLVVGPYSWLKITGFGLFGNRQVVPELPRIISGFISWYPKFPNKIRVPDIMGSGLKIPGSGIGLWVFCPGLHRTGNVEESYALVVDQMKRKV
jgi:hypothetical protein